MIWSLPIFRLIASPFYFASYPETLRSLPSLFFPSIPLRPGAHSYIGTCCFHRALCPLILTYSGLLIQVSDQKFSSLSVTSKPTTSILSKSLPTWAPKLFPLNQNQKYFNLLIGLWSLTLTRPLHPAPRMPHEKRDLVWHVHC